MRAESGGLRGGGPGGALYEKMARGEGGDMRDRYSLPSHTHTLTHLHTHTHTHGESERPHHQTNRTTPRKISPLSVNN